MGLDATIAGLLNNILASGHLAWPIVAENVRDEKHARTPFLVPSLMPAEPEVLTLGPGAYLHHTGIFQIVANYQVGDGWGPARQMADSVAALFVRGARYTSGAVTVTILKAWTGPGMIDGAWYQIPVSVTYECFAQAS